MLRKNVIIIGAAGRDFHNFNTFFRYNEAYNVVGFTAAQLPFIHERHYPHTLAGEELYPYGISIYPEQDLPKLIKEKEIDFCVFSYSDVSYEHVMKISSIVHAAGANFLLLGPDNTMLKSRKPVISICATRTGCGKSQTSRKVCELLMQHGIRVVIIRHPMPYGNLIRQKLQRYESLSDLKEHKCTIEEMEEYEPHLERGNVIYAGVDYEAILHAAEKDPKGCDVILWEGGNNDFSFFKSDLYITVTDPLRAGSEVSYYPGEVNLRLADVIIINKIDSASLPEIHSLRENIQQTNQSAIVIDAASPVRVDKPDLIRNKRVLVIEDGPTLTHGNMQVGAGVIAAQRYNASEIVDPRPYLVGQLKETFKTYPKIGNLLPAMGYGNDQTRDLEESINRTNCDSVVIGTPINLSRIIKIKKPTVRVFYDLAEISQPGLEEVIENFIAEKRIKTRKL